MKLFIGIIVVSLWAAPVAAEVSSIDFVHIKNGNRAEAIYYYENNWLKYRIAAKQAGMIHAYEFLVTESDDAEVDIVLITVYADAQQFAQREANFEIVMADAQGRGPRLLNEIPPGEFREVMFGSEYIAHE